MSDLKAVDAKITPQAIRAELERILACEAFARSPRMQRFLRFIVEETLAGRGDQLGEYAIGTAVFDRGSDFEPGLDPIVRNDARRLRVKLLECYRRTHPRAAGHVLIDVPKGGYTPVFLPASSGRADGFPPHGCSRRLAVLPFEVLSAAPESVTYSRALGLSLTARLTNLEGLELIAYGYAGDQPSHLISGGILKSAGRFRVTVNLIQVSGGVQIWAREYEFGSDEILADQSKIVANVLHEVTARLGMQQIQPRRLALVA